MSSTVDPNIVKSIPPALLKTLPAGQPPKGIKPNFADPPTRVPEILGVCTAFIVLTLVCFAIRIYTKLAIAKEWKWDDLTCSLGLMCSVVYFGSVVNGCVNGATGRHTWDLHVDKLLSSANLYQSYITLIIVTPALGLIKSSLFIQYYLLFRPLRWVRIAVWIGVAVSTVFYVVVSLAGFILASPWPGESFLDDILSSHYLKFLGFSIPTGVVGMLVDWYLFILPIPVVLRLQMSTAKKIGVLVVFMTGGLAAIASTISLYYRVQLDRNLSDATWGVGYVFLWRQIEMFAGVTASSMPTVNQFFTHQNISFTSWTLSFNSILTSLLGRSAPEKHPDSNNVFTDWRGNKTEASTETRRYRMNDLESNALGRKEAKAPQVAGDSAIHLIQDVYVAHEHHEDASLIWGVRGRYGLV